MTVKMNMVQKSYIVSFLLLTILLTIGIIEIPFEKILVLADVTILSVLSVLQLIEFNRVKKLLIKTSDILSRGNERDFSVLQDKEKNIINYKITNLIEQLEDSVKQSNTILDEKEKLAEEVENYKSSLENIQNSLNRDVMSLKTQMSEYSDQINEILSDFSIINDSSDTEDNLLNKLMEVYSSYRENYGTNHQSIEKSRNISDREIGRSEQLIESLSGLYDKSENNDEELSEIFKGIENIRDVTDIINKVSEKASILSLNAAIESAHAGEAGKGFAVVAEEVGVLATSTAEHAEYINKALYSVTDLIFENKQSEHNEIDSYPELIGEVRKINGAFIKLKELLDLISLQNMPESLDVLDVRTKEKNILSNSIGKLTVLKSHMEQSFDKIGKLVILQRSPLKEKKQNQGLHIHETSLKPVDSDTPLDL